MNFHNTNRLSHSMNYPVGEYIQANIPPIKELFDNFLRVAQLDIESQPIINICGRGSSGTIIGTIFSQGLLTVYPDKKTVFTHIAKPSEESHHVDAGNREDYLGLNVLVDDFISSGNTIRKSMEYIRSATENPNFKMDYICLDRVTYWDKEKLEEWNYTENLIGNKLNF